MELIVQLGGRVRCVYGEEIDLAQLGRLSISRGSYVEPNETGRWHVDLSPVGGPRLEPFSCRSDALAAEVDWLAAHWLPQPSM